MYKFAKYIYINLSKISKKIIQAVIIQRIRTVT
jgi:hypothetical protein